MLGQAPGLELEQRVDAVLLGEPRHRVAERLERDAELRCIAAKTSISGLVSTPPKSLTTRTDLAHASARRSTS